MSFAELVASSVAPERKEVKVGKFTFYATELKPYERLHLGNIQASGKEGFSEMVLYSIVDADGNHMTRDQLEALSDEVFIQFFNAAIEVNTKAEEKN